MHIRCETGVTIQLLHNVENVADDNIDARIQIPGEATRTVTFSTLGNIASILKRYEFTGECLSGMFFWAIDLVIVKDLKLETIEATVLEMMRTGEYARAFGKASADDYAGSEV